ncbi:hypothetical protein EIN_187330 [Entamoeba invadens IP1]|uniref:hypothetical protein n=1 Tax=Entamoeba invadens IP1 TaxID=370355 RepID=UPI0002C3DA2D|nr:hypothetical protein EIN_187330 [Entamoeba invadens IP1]ELP94266.1 hypothetical protein EIN_187330 [Entamoeba invadens IP1]|eukprot:XP_004261037.1 hypothetical protein EIN_187330 [Entamoeba invadens IP1]
MSNVSVKNLEKYFEDERTNRDIVKSLRLFSPVFDATKPYFDQFVIVGSDAAEVGIYQQCGYKKRFAKTKSTILFQYPTTQIEGFSYHLLQEFCFPNGVNRMKFIKQKERSVAEEGQKTISDHMDYKNVFSFVFNGKDGEMFAVGLRKRRFILVNSKEYETDEVCYVLLTQVPYFVSHIHFLEALLLQPELNSQDQYIKSSAIFFLLSVIFPFKYESPVISELCEELYTVLESPTPVLIGLTQIPPKTPLEKQYTFIADFDNNKFICDEKCLFPDAAGWVIERIQDILKRAPKRNAKQKIPMTTLIAREMDATNDIVHAINKAMNNIVEPFPYFCLKNVYEETGKDNISTFLADSYLAFWSGDDLAFMKKFVKTQIFESFKLRKLLEIDGNAAKK